MKTAVMYIDSLLSIPFVIVGILFEFAISSVKAGRTLYGKFLRSLS
jgi:hypothetical protein